MPSDYQAHTHTLSLDEQQQAHEVAAERHRQAGQRGASERYGLPKSQAMAAHETGAMGERAAASYFQLPWRAPTDFNSRDDGDIGVDGVEVKTTRHQNGRLLVQPDAIDGRQYILVTWIDGTATIRGWMWGWEAKRFPLFNAPPGRARPHAVPQSELHPPETLKDDDGTPSDPASS